MKRSFALSLVPLLAQVAPLLAAPTATRPNDPFFPQQWALHDDGTQTVTVDIDNLHTLAQKGVPGVDIGWLEARDEARRLAVAPITVAVIDSGVDPNHPDLQGRIAPDGYDFLASSSTVGDDLGHGTHVSGIIAANDDNGVGVAGVAPAAVKILPLRILSNKFQNFSYAGKLISDYAADAINYAVAHRASVINMSLGWPKIVDSEKARQAVQDAVKSGVLIVASAGNDRKDDPTYPCAYEGVLCVGSVSNNGKMSIYSNTGGLVDLLAPGDGIVSSYPTAVESNTLRIQGYERLSGTSQASPMVAAIAAVLRSANPGIPLDELRARLLASTRPLPSAGAALYGLVNLRAALEAVPQPVFLPDFKAIDEIPLDEGTLRVQGAISVENLWQAASGVQAQVTVNGKEAGSAQAGSLAPGQRLSVPWSYQFSSLDDSSVLRIGIQISDGARHSRAFSQSFSVARPMRDMPGRQSIAVPMEAGKAPDWIGTNKGHLYSKLSSVAFYARPAGLPAYFRQTTPADSTAKSATVEIFDSASGASIRTIQVPSIYKVTQVMKIDVNGDGKMDWLILGVGKADSQLFFQFDFLDSGFQPLWKDGSIRQIDLDSTFGQIILRNYAAPGTWVKADGKLVPCFAAQGLLPDPDNYSGLDPFHFQSGTHLYYLAPQNPQPASSNGVVQLEIRALDSAAFRQNFQQLQVNALLIADTEDQRTGHLHAVLGVGDGLDAQALLWDIRSITDNSTSPAPGWDSLSSSGLPVPDLPGNSSALLSFFDQARGSITWAAPDGRFIERTEFSYKSAEDPITGLIGTFDLTRLGRFWFIESGFDLVAYHQGVAGGAVGVRSLPIERDSSFPGEEFSELFSPVLVGASSQPLPGIYIDSTLVRGDRVSVVTWNTAKGSLEKPLRYSMQVPPGCVQMTPVQLAASQGQGLFALPVLCQKGSALELTIVRPATP